MTSRTRFPVSALRSVELQVPNLEKAVAFYTRVWGLIEAHRHSGTVYLRGASTDPYLLALREGRAPGVEGVTFRADPDADLVDLRGRLVDAGACDVGEVSDVSAWGGGVGFSVCDRAGRRYFIVQDDDRLDPVEHAGLSPRRLAHVNINCSDVEHDIRFFSEGFGFLLTDRSKVMGFLRTNDDHHAVVLTQDTVDTLNHISFLHDTIDDMMEAGGKMCDAGYDIGWGPGRHGPGNNVFLYFVDPFGIVVEHTAEVLQVDDSYATGGPEKWIWPEGRSDHWGIALPKSDTCKRAQRAIPFL